MPPCPLLAEFASCPLELDSRLSALVMKFGCVLFGGTGVYGALPSGFCPCGKIAFFGAFGPDGRGSLSSGVGAREVLGVAGDGNTPAIALLLGEEENLEDMLESHELRRVPGEADFGKLPVLVPPPLFSFS